ncbi:hypothetical protein VB005_01685 [Metarhizium brunneum]
MDRHKTLPPEPTRQQDPEQLGSFSPETYIQLLEDENEQLRLRNQELIKQMRALEAKLAAEIQTKASLSENLKETKGEIRRRDETIANIAGRIVQEFQRYADSVQAQSVEEGYIPIGYSYFDSSS